jgi:hypothetical protein
MMVLGISTSIKYASWMVLLSTALSDLLLRTSYSIAYNWISLISTVAHIYKTALVFPLAVHS